MIIAVSRLAAPNVRPKVATLTGNHNAEQVSSAVFTRLGWNPAKIVPSAEGRFWAYHPKAV